jgi:hypothetical protein
MAGACFSQLATRNVLPVTYHSPLALHQLQLQRQRQRQLWWQRQLQLQLQWRSREST